jgi:integrase
MLKALPQHGEWVFSSPGSTEVSLKKGITFIRWRRIRKRAGLPDVTIHDLRRTVASWLACSGENLAVIARVLGHTSLANTAIYARLNLAPVQSALTQHADMLLGMGSVAASQQVASAMPMTGAQASLAMARPDEDLSEWPG